MLEKKTVIDQIELTRHGTTQVRFAVLILDDGVEISRRWHRTAVDFFGDVQDQLDRVNTHLVEMNEAVVEQPEIDDLKGYVDLHRARLNARGTAPDPLER